MKSHSLQSFSLISPPFCLLFKDSSLNPKTVSTMPTMNCLCNELTIKLLCHWALFAFAAKRLTGEQLPTYPNCDELRWKEMKRLTKTSSWPCRWKYKIAPLVMCCVCVCVCVLWRVVSGQWSVWSCCYLTHCRESGLWHFYLLESGTLLVLLLLWKVTSDRIERQKGHWLHFGDR